MNRLGNYFSDRANQEIIQLKTPDEEFYQIEIINEAKRELNHFKLRNFLSETRKQQKEELKAVRRIGYFFKVKINGANNQLRNVNKFKYLPC